MLYTNCYTSILKYVYNYYKIHVKLFIYKELTSDVYGGTTDIVTGIPREDV